MRILSLQVPLLSLIFFEVVLVLWCLVGRIYQHSEPARGVSSLVPAEVPAGNVCLEGPPPPLGTFLLDNHCNKSLLQHG